MATVIPYKDKDGKTISYQIQVFRGRDKDGKKLKPYTMSWKIPETYRSEKAILKALDKVVGEFETECKRGERSIDRRTFRQYSEYVLTLKKRDNKKKTVFRYEQLLERINEEIGEIKMRDLTGEDLNRLYISLGKERTLYKDMATPNIDFKKLLKERGQTQKDFCMQASVGNKTLAAVLQSKCIKVETASKIANYLDMPINCLFDTVKAGKTEQLSPQTIMHHHRLINNILMIARKERIVTANVAEEATPPKVPKREAEFFEIDEIIAIRSALKEQALKWQAIVMLLIDTGARRGEIMGLRWHSIDFANNTIIMENNLQYLPSEGIYDETLKTDETRTVAISPQVMKCLKKLQYEQKVYKLQVGPMWQERGYCFTGESGKPIHPNSLNGWLNKLSAKYNLPKVHPHKFRHSQASILYANNVDIVTISNRLGHSEVSTTQNIYAHMMKESDKKAQEAIANALYHQQS